MRQTHLASGLAVATLALAAIGASAGPVAADTVSQQVGSSGIVWYSQSTHLATPRADGTDSSIRLEVGASADVTGVAFSYSTDGGATFSPIATASARNDNGAFAVEWASPFPSGATGVVLRATSTGSPSVLADRTGVVVDRVNGTNASVNLDSAEDLGYFVQDYGSHNQTLARVTGTTSATDGDVSVYWQRGTGAAANAVSVPVQAAAGAGTGTFAGGLDLTGYAFGAADQLVLGASRDSDDVEAVQLHRQHILGGKVTVTPSATKVPTGGTVTTTVTVKDSSGRPIVGAQVYRAAAGSTSATGSPQYTDADGQAVLAQPGGTSYFFANADDDGVFNTPADEASSNVTVSAYDPVPTRITAASADGPAFDLDEYAAGDITATVRDQEGAPVKVGASQRLAYYWQITPSDGSAVVRVPAGSATTNAPVDATGTATIALPANQKAGVYDLYTSLITPGGLLTPATTQIAASKTLSVRAGQAAVAFDAVSPEQAAAGGSITVTGSLELEDGTPLAGRRLHAVYSRGTEPGGGGDAYLVTAGGTPSTLSDETTTGASGGFSFVVRDPAKTPQPAETGGSIGVTSVANSLGDAGASATGHRVDFLASVTPGTLVPGAQTALGGAAGRTPGRPVSSSFVVKTADGVPLSNQSVSLSLDHGFFTPYAATAGALTPETSPVAGADTGVYKSLGSTITVRTDADGVAVYTAAIGRDQGFDDDGLVDATVTATVGSLTKTDKVAWTSANPLNGGAVRLTPAPAPGQQSGVLPKAPVTDEVGLDVAVTDQFGNAVGGQTVELSSSSPSSATLSAASVVSDFVADADVTARSATAQSQTVQATWKASTSTYGTTTPPVASAGTESLSATYAIAWYAVDLTHSTFTLDHEGADVLPVSSRVPVAFTALDQFGEPISDLYVEIYRIGPARSDDSGDPEVEELTGQDGKVEYRFVGGVAGTAYLGTVVRIGSQSGERLAAAELRDTVTFEADSPTQVAIKPSLRLKNVNGGNDRITISAPRAAGATVTLYRIDKHEVAHRVRTGVLGSSGRVVFVLPDAKRKQVTRYGAIVAATDTTQQGVTRKAGIR